MDQLRLVVVAVAASALGGFLLGGGLTASRVAATTALEQTEDLPAAPVIDPALAPVVADLGPLFAPIWTRSRISGFVAAEFKVELAPGTSASPVLPPVQDRVLAVLYRAGAEGRLDPGRTDPEELRAELLAAARAAAAPAELRDLRIGKLVHQENRR